MMVEIKVAVFQAVLEGMKSNNFVIYVWGLQTVSDFYS